MDYRSKHLLVLVHGLWGNASHFDYVSRAIDQYYVYDDLAPAAASTETADGTVMREYVDSDRDRLTKSDIEEKGLSVQEKVAALLQAGALAHNSKYRKPYILVTRSNEGYLTYDGIDMCGEKVADEIEQALESYEKQNIQIDKISVVGYSLGGLMARYAIGILYTKGIFKKVTPVNFTTFCTPHIGVRAPGKDLPTTLFNTLVPRTISATGRQLFMLDNFSNTSMPLINLLADKSSIFFHALELFSNHALYANIVNDRRTSWFTAGISHTDPFLDLHTVSLNHLPGYSPTILDVSNPVSMRKRSHDDDVTYSSHDPLCDLSGNGTVTGVQARAKSLTVLPGLSVMLIKLVFISPIYVLAFLISASIQTFYSSRRLREFHSNRKGRYGLDEFRLPRLDEQVEDVVDTVLGDFIPYGISHSLVDNLLEDSDSNDESLLNLEQKPYDYIPPLELSDGQLQMIRSLNTVSWKKFPVHITKTKAAHAAVIVRHMDWKGMEEGEVVIRHWLREILEM
ncbi:putative serine esterase-domain-containing protein [Limtongia smithiae]|uniref:putative serine esterase-domain-containing protein n=1 Tax=Limtongia smithiae TaxID=1125753 RepID=UPI0034CD5BB0